MTHPFPTRRSSDLRRSRTAPTRSTASTRSRTTSPTTGPSDMAEGRRVLVIGPEPTSWSEWAADLVVHGPVLVALARQDFQTRYKRARSEEHTSELQSLMRNSYAVFCLKKKT